MGSARRVWVPQMSYAGKTSKQNLCVFAVAESVRSTMCVVCRKHVQKGEPIVYFWSIRRALCVSCAKTELEQAAEALEKPLRMGAEWVEYARLLRDA